MTVAQQHGCFQNTRNPGDALLGIVVAGLDQLSGKSGIYCLRRDLREDGTSVEAVPLIEEFGGRDGVLWSVGVNDTPARMQRDRAIKQELDGYLQEARSELRQQM